MLWSIVTESKAAIGKKFSEVKSLVKVFTVRDVDSLLSYCGEFISSPAEAYLQEAAQGRNVRQLHELAKMARQARKEVGRMLTQDELAAAVSNWKKTGSIKKAVQAAIDWAKLGFNNGSKYIKDNLIQYIKDIREIREIRENMPNSTLRKRGNMAAADVDIYGIKNKFIARSKINNKLDKGADIADFSYLKSENERIFTSYVEDQFMRYHDTEAKILEDIASQINDPKISGTIDLYSELPCCQSCSNIILEFRQKFPNIQLNIYVQ